MLSNAINIFLRKTVEQRGIPFPVNINSQRVGGLSSSDITGIFNRAVEQDITEKKKKGLPVARFDLDKKRAYLENIDGTREYV